MPESLVLYKLIILYMLNKVDFPLTNAQISEFILDKEYTNYFTLQQVLSELIDTGLVNVTTTHNSSLYRITKEGLDTLDYFSSKISQPIIEDIEEYLHEKQLELKNENSILADFYKTTSKTYAVNCKIKDHKENLLDITLSASSAKEAEAMCDNWQKHHDEIYAFLLSILMQ